MKRQGFPFAAVLGMEKVKEAVTMALVNPAREGCSSAAQREQENRRWRGERVN